MSITVVTTRDYEGAPTTRDVYADAVRYRVGDSNLEIYSAQSQLLAFYGSGNWQSVLVDDPVLVHQGPPDPSVYEGMPMTSDLVTPGRTTGPRPGRGGPGAGAGVGAGQAPPAEVVPRAPVTIQQRPRPEVRPAEPVPEPAEVRPAAASAEMLARSPSMRRVRFAPKVYRAARPGAAPREPGTSWSPPASIRPVVFRPKVYRAAREAADAAEAPAERPDDED